MDSLLLILYIYSFLIGICIASFLNVVIWRLPQGLSFVKGRSFCPACEHQLKWYDLFPVFSYLFLKGKCRYCRSKIPVRDTVLEFLGGCIGILCFYLYGFSWDTIVVFAIFMILLTITMIDFDTMTIPNGLIIALLVPVGMFTALHTEMDIVTRCIGFFIVSLPMYLLTVLIPDCFGGGDIKLIAVAGFLLGWKLTLLAFFISVIIGGCYAIFLLLSKITEKGAHIAFGPYLCTGIMISLLYGEKLIQVYLSLFGL